MNPEHFLRRLRAGLRPDTNSLVRFIKEETYINLKPYSFVGHEYQQYFTELIEKDPNFNITAEKCSQIGLSEICFRIVLSLMALNPGYSAIYAMPSKQFAMEVLKTRIATIIDDSPPLKTLIRHDVDSAAVKMFRNNSIMYALGASANSSASLINRPITLAVTDELDKCDYDTHTGLRSRQTHSVYKPRIAISTPTAPGIGINAEAENRQLHYQIMICPHCKAEFVPDYYQQVKVPGFPDPISTLSAEKVRSLNLNIRRSYHHCPKCHAKLSGRPIPRQWVVEQKHIPEIHLRLTPFDAPSFITPYDLVQSQLTYSSRSEFDNQSLGLPSQLSDSTIARENFKFITDEIPSGIRVGGLDLGKTSYMLQGTLANGVLIVHSPDMIPVGELEHRVTSTIVTNNLISVVGDSMPFLDVIHRLTNRHPMFWGSIYTTPMQPQPELYKLKMNDEEQVRQVQIQKSLFMDHVASMIISQQIVFQSNPLQESMIQHFTDMRRVRDHKFSEMRYQWIKSAKGVDHWWHTLCYLVCASKLIMKSGNSGMLPLDVLLSSIKLHVEV